MKLTFALALLSLFALPAHADQIIDYTLTVQNAPLSGADFSWTVQTDGFITTPPPAVYQCIQNCDESPEHWIRQCVEFCNPGFYDSFVSVSEPQSDEGCSISKVWMEPNYAPATYFSPLCDGIYDGYSGGGLPDPGTLGTWTWNWLNPDGTENEVTLSITDPVGAPEPGTWGLLLCGVVIFSISRVGREGHATEV